MPAALATVCADLDVARAVLGTEAQALRALATALDEEFTRAVEILANASGRVVVSGMGKSGHVGRKLTATLASTGTPALFVHPAEASHGDLGMIVGGDAVLALSNSGETPELADIVAHARRFALPIVAVTARRGSALARAADAVLLLPQAPEACPMGLAPTTSTVMQMALGDALAVALLTRRGFTAADFGRFHPGGRLGARLRRVGELMHKGEEMPLAPPDLPMHQALLRMTEKRFGCLGVAEAAGRLVGIVTDGDLRRHMGPDLLGRRVGEIMTPDPRTITADALAAEALRVMNAWERPITALFVVDRDRRPVGILHVHDLLRAGVA
ncbi:MAG: KpsF/GutQ family sugar-phosphate isomerase [Acetobacteraceae bacterium]|nr:KpsF/GutQ family sugar-phosphate isomerase [Acetobacteraceae bacterium]